MDVSVGLLFLFVLFKGHHGRSKGIYRRPDEAAL